MPKNHEKFWLDITLGLK